MILPNTSRRWFAFATVVGTTALMHAAVSTSHAQPFGIATRTANTSLLIDRLTDETPPPVAIARVFPRLAFNAPVYMVEGPDTTKRMYVVERRGLVKVFTRTADPDPASVTTLLDISNIVHDNGDEYGMFGLALDPDYANPSSAQYGRFYVLYKYGTNDASTALSPTRISRFTNPNPGGNATVSPSTEQVLLEFNPPGKRHTAGWMDFGPDNLLYFTAGDGEWGDPGKFAQNRGTLNGKINRIDVRSTPSPGLAYRIPANNPFVNEPGARGEVYAYGLRNPWRASFDKLSGILYCGDVGDSEWEEVNLILPGGNYGWRKKEGYACYVPTLYYDPAPDCSEDPNHPFIYPLKYYRHSSGYQTGRSVTLGYVYYGQSIPQLYGHLIYGDFVFGVIWSLKFDGSTITNESFLASTGKLIPTFAQDHEGEIYFFEYSGASGVYKLVPASVPPTSGQPVPDRLSRIPALLNAGKGIDQTNAGIIPYTPVSPLWSDGTLKERFLALPGTSTMGYTAAGGWNMPEKTVIVKNFLLPMDDRNPSGTAKRIETRVMFKLNNEWNGYSYEWDDTGTDALLLSATGKARPFTRIDSTGTPYSYTWNYPSRAQCFQCHTNGSNVVLGICTPQLNSTRTYPASGVADNQLRTMEHIGLLSAPLPAPPASLPKMVDPLVAGPPLVDRAKSYLDTNCAMCHRPEGSAQGGLDLRWETALGSMGIVNVIPGASLGLTDARIVAPGAPNRSTLVARMESLEPSIRMPRVGSNKIDTNAAALMRSWISSLPMPTSTPVPTTTPAPTTTPNPSATPRVRTSGLSVLVDGSSGAPSFVAYFVNFGGGFVYQGDSGWITSNDYDITFPNWPYGTLPLRLQAYGGNPSGGVAGIYPIGSTTLSAGTISRVTPAPTITPKMENGGLTVLVSSPAGAPSFVAYYVDFGAGFIYQGDSGWIHSEDYNLTFNNWPYGTLPLKLQAYGGNPAGGVAGIYPIGSTTLRASTISSTKP